MAPTAVEIIAPLRGQLGTGLSNLVYDILALGETNKRLQNDLDESRRKYENSSIGLTVAIVDEVAGEISDIRRLLENHTADLSRMGHSITGGYLKKDIDKKLDRIEELCRTNKRT